MRVLLAAITCEKGDVAGNMVRHLEALHEAADAGCALAVFPEMSLTGPSGVVICAESHVDLTWDASTAHGERFITLCSVDRLADWRPGTLVVEVPLP